MLSIITHWRRERIAVNELSRLSDRELADLGIHRQDIRTVVRSAHAVTHDEGTASDRKPFVVAALGPSPAVETAASVYRPASLAA